MLFPLSSDRLKSLPLFIKQAYEFLEGELYFRKCIFLHSLSENNFGPEQFRIHAEMIEKALQAEVVFVFDRIESFKRDRLIERRINFIVPERQLFLPSLLIDLKDFDLKPKSKRRLLPPAAQCLLLYHLQRESLDGKSFKELESRLPYSYLMITRSVRDLYSLSLCSLSKEKEKRLIFNDERSVVWEKALPYLSNPIKKVYFTDDRIPETSVKFSGISALSQYTMISNESLITVAICAKDFRALRENNAIADLQAQDGTYCLQIWKYSPAAISQTKFADPLSLFLTFNDTKDERIEQARHAMVKEVIW